jgi:hypothetical protein
VAHEHRSPGVAGPSNTEPEDAEEPDLTGPGSTKTLRTQGEFRKSSSVSSRLHALTGFFFQGSPARLGAANIRSNAERIRIRFLITIPLVV